MDILFLAHCVPNPPNKGEKIRAHQEINALSRNHNVHLVCFGRNQQELTYADQLKDRCTSVYAEVLSFPRALMGAAVKFAMGGCVNLHFYRSSTMKRYVRDLSAKIPFDVTIAYALPMVPYAPANVPVVFDMQDVDSEKWFEYSRMRQPAILYRTEARRIRQLEIEFAKTSRTTYLTARQETDLFRSIAPQCSVECMENGVDADFFDPAIVPSLPELLDRRFVAFVGTMDYFPNIDAVQWFANQVFPALRRQYPDLEFLIVGNNPSKAVQQLSSLEGVTVTGGVPDVRPYILQSRAIVAPLRLARGIQNKVLEALTLGKPVIATSAVCRTFGEEVPAAIIRCDSAEDQVTQISQFLDRKPVSDPQIRKQMHARFSWKTNVSQFVRRVEEIGQSTLAPTAV